MSDDFKLRSFGAPEWQSRLSQIPTNHSLVRRAEHSSSARTQLVLRYQNAIKAVLTEHLTREKLAPNEEAAKEMAESIFKRLAGRLMNMGADKWADRKENRFRDQLREWACKELSDYSSGRRPHPLSPERAFDAEDFDMAIGKAILDKVWKTLEQIQKVREAEAKEKGETNDSIPYTCLRCRKDHPKAKSEQIAKLLSAQIGRELNAVAVRKIMSRAKKKFDKLLLEEVKKWQPPDVEPKELVREFERLGLMNYALDSKTISAYLNLQGNFDGNDRTRRRSERRQKPSQS